MKFTRNFALTITIAVCFLGCSNAQQPERDAKVSQPERKVLIVYLSRTNNTKAISEFMHDEVGGTIVPLELEKPYPANYRATVEQVVRENETGSLPPLKTKIDRVGQYDVVFVGFPTWGMKLPPPMKLPAVIQFQRQDGHSVQHERRIRRRQQLRDGQGVVP